MIVLKECPPWWGLLQVERVTADRVVHYGPALIFAVAIASDGGGDADADLYDGQSADGKKLFDLYAVDEAFAQLTFPAPVPMQQGIYVDIGTNCESVTILYLPLHP